jgi:hypothetical protein
VFTWTVIHSLVTAPQDGHDGHAEFQLIMLCHAQRSKAVGRGK